MALSSDEIIKREIADDVGERKDIKLRIFTQSSNEDQALFAKGGLTFGYNNVNYGSCDACWYVEEKWIDGFDGHVYNKKPIIALEGTDALNRRSSGNAQYQRFHHALGAVKNGIVGIYYLKKGVDKIQEDLFGMAYFASKVEKGKYLIIDDLSVVNDLLDLYSNRDEFNKYINSYLEKMFSIFNEKFQKYYDGDWNNFCKKRSTIVIGDLVIKYAGRMRRNFTDSSQRAGHIAVGEMYLTKYYFPKKQIYYFFPKMTADDLKYLDEHKASDKEWYLLRHEPGVTIKTIDDIKNVKEDTKKRLIAIKDDPLKGEVLKEYSLLVNDIVNGIINKSLKIV